jgi:uncharacterized RmlC-like cupin family protein
LASRTPAIRQLINFSDQEFLSLVLASFVGKALYRRRIFTGRDRTMTKLRDWEAGVRVTRGADLAETLAGPAGGGATAIEFAGTGGAKTWIGRVAMAPGSRTGAHRHGRHEAALFILSGAGRILWGDGLEFAADVGPGDFVYFAPYVPHEEINLDPVAPLQFVVIRSDGERIIEPLEIAAANNPERISASLGPPKR